MGEYRIEHDTMGQVEVPTDSMWGAQTQRSLMNFAIGNETIPREVIEAFIVLKKACALSNYDLGKLDETRRDALVTACDRILKGEFKDEFPLKVWQTGSGTQSNMNVNEVISHVAALTHGETPLHPNDHVNMSQSSNDTFPTAMYMAAYIAIKDELEPAAKKLIETLKAKEEECEDIIKIGRTHLQDAVPLKLSQEISAWRVMVKEGLSMISQAAQSLRYLAIGGTAVGTGLNAPKDFDRICTGHISEITGYEFLPSENKFHALTSKDAYVYTHGALKALGANLMKIANDVRFLASGPRCGYGELSIPENEPGSSIMPGKVNPTQCEAITMIAIQVMGNDVTIGMGASQGNFQLNVFMPVLAYNMLQSIRLLADGMVSFEKNCIRGLTPNREQIQKYLNESLMLVTCLSPEIGYENAAACAKKAFKENTTLKEAVVSMGFMSEKQYDIKVDARLMV